MKLLGYLLAFIAMFFWSGWYIVSKTGLNSSLTRWDIILLRFTVASIISLPFLWRERKFFRQIFSLKYFILAMSSGLFYLIFVLKGIEISSVSNSGVFNNGSLPVFSSALAYFCFKSKINKFQFIGILLIVCANAILFVYSDTVSYTGAFYLFLGGVLYSFYLVCNKYWDVKIEYLVIASPIINFICFLPLYFFMPSNIANSSFKEIAFQGFYQGALVNFIGIFIIAKSILILNSVIVSSILAMTPCMAAILALLILGEPFSMCKIIAIVLCSIGVLVCNGGDYIYNSLISKNNK